MPIWHVLIAPSHCITPGDDAVKFESLSDDVVVAKAVSVLRSIFGDQTVPEVGFAQRLAFSALTPSHTFM